MANFLTEFSERIEGSRPAVQSRDAAPTPTGFAEIVSDDFPVLHAGGLCLFCSRLTAASPRRASGNGDRRAKSPIADGVLKALA